MDEWDAIAIHFDETRNRAWKECEEFVEKQEGMGLDIGCGNGRHLKIMEKAGKAVGVDISFKMLEIARKNAANSVLIQSDARYLPFRNEVFDYVLFIASLHNIQGREERIRALNEMRRVMKGNSYGIISVWARWQDRWRWHFLKEFFIRKEKEFGDIYVPWKRGVRVDRFYHLYSMRELKKDVKKAGFNIIKAWSVKKASKKHADNHFVIVRK